MRKNRAFRIIFKIGLWAMVLLAALLLVKFYQEKQHPSIKEIKTISVRYKMMNVGLISTGVIEPMEHVGVRAEIGGILRDMKWQRGEIIKKGVLWGIIDSPEVISNLQNIEGIKVKVQQMDIDCQNALKKYTRSKELYSKGVVSREMMEMAEVEYNKIHLSEQLLKQQLKVEEERERRLEEQIKIASPISGVILKQDIEEGMVITPGTILFIVANLDKLAVKCNIPEVDIGRVKKDMEVRITAETLPGKEFQGKIVKVSPFPMESSNISLFEVVISIEKPFQGLQIGRGVNVEIFSIQEGKSLVVPIEAISIKEDKKMVFVVEDGRAWEREITIGMVDVENKNIEITSGLKEGEEISILAEEELTEGMKVESIKVPERR